MLKPVPLVAPIMQNFGFIQLRYREAVFGSGVSIDGRSSQHCDDWTLLVQWHRTYPFLCYLRLLLFKFPCDDRRIGNAPTPEGAGVPLGV